MRVMLHDVFGAMPAALAMWLVLVGLVIIGCGFTAAPAVCRQRRASRVQAETVRLRRVQLGAQAADLSDVLSHRNGWDLGRHPADHEVRLRRTACERLLAAYRAVAALEDAARHEAEVAAASAVSLRHEATSATARAQLAAEIVAVRTRRSDRFATAGSILVPGH